MSEQAPGLPGDAVLAAATRGLGGSVTIERVQSGTSTPVYRLSLADQVAYLRVGEHRGHRLDVEVAAHEQLRSRGVRVPEVLAFDPFDDRLERPVMIVAALPGASLADDPLPADRAATVLRAAGRDIGTITAVPVDGFGFVLRDGAPWPPRAPHSNAAASLLGDWVAEDADELLDVEATPARARGLGAVRAWAEQELGRCVRACLVHGDLDPSHVFHDDGGYTGLIDLGELRGATPDDDLARFALWHGPGANLGALTDGYRDVAELPDDHDLRRRHLAVLQGVQQLARWRRRDGADWAARPTVRRLAASVGALLDACP